MVKEERESCKKKLKEDEQSSNSHNHNKKDFSVDEFILKIKI
jgi:hypothetical protein